MSQLNCHLSDMGERVQLAQEVLDRLLVAKRLLDQIRFLPTAKPDRITLARHVLTAHDAAELIAAAIAEHRGEAPESTSYLMNYIAAIKKLHPNRNVQGRGYFSQLNRVRTDIKHHGIFPDPQQWYRVGERTWEYASGWCQEYLGLSLQELHESTLISDPTVKELYNFAVEAFRRGNHKETLEQLAFATNALFESNKALYNLSVGESHAEDAIKLAAFGVHANDYLALQEFLPRVFYNRENKVAIKWVQGKYGHPANWKKGTAEFCLKTFVDMALCIQDADRIPGAIDFNLIYCHKITALEDGVKITQGATGLMRMMGQEEVVVRTLQKGESLQGSVKGKAPSYIPTIPGEPREKPMLEFISHDVTIFGDVEKDKVRVTCVPLDNKIVAKYFPDLPEIEFDP